MLGLAAFTFRPDGPTAAVIEALARRMEVAIDDPAVRILFDTWAVLMATAAGVTRVATTGGPAPSAIGSSRPTPFSPGCGTRGTAEDQTPAGGPRGDSDYLHLERAVA